MGRTILGIIAGLAAMLAVIMAVEALGHILYPPPAGLNPMVTDDMAKIMLAMPAAAKALVLVAWLAGAFIGGWIGAKIATQHPRIAAVIVAAVVACGGDRNDPADAGTSAVAGGTGLAAAGSCALLAAKLAGPRMLVPTDQPSR